MGRRLAMGLGLLAAASGWAAPGFRYAEVMPGYLTPGRADQAEDGTSQRARLAVTGTVADFEAFMADPDHPMRLDGELRIQDASGGWQRFPVAGGRLRFLAPGEGAATRYTTYDFELPGTPGGRLYFHGWKRIHDDPGMDMSRDLLDLNATVRRGGPEGPVVASGVLRVEAEKPWVLARFVGSFRVPGATGMRQRISVLRRYLKLYLGALREVYFGD